VAGVALLTVASLISLLVTRFQPPAGLLKTPEGVVTAFVQAIQAGNADQAWSYVSPSATVAGPPPAPPTRPVIGKDDFRREVEATRGQQPARIRILDVSRNGDSATVRLEVTEVSGGLFSSPSSHTVSLTLSRQDGSWLITSDPSPWQFL
jgi:ketosteroid isomerase-like protein